MLYNRNQMDETLFYSYLKIIMYKAPIVAYKELGRETLLNIADTLEVGRREREEQYLDFIKRNGSSDVILNTRQRVIHRLSISDIENKLIELDQGLLPLVSPYHGANLVLRIAQGQFCRAFHSLHSCYSVKDINYHTLHSYEIYLLGRALGLESAQGRNAAKLCEDLLIYMNKRRYEKIKQEFIIQ